jgi:hypothetical protein
MKEIRWSGEGPAFQVVSVGDSKAEEMVEPA